MRPQGLRGLGLLLVLCVLVALSPIVPWGLAQVFDQVDQGWLGSLSGFVVTVPVALGLAALVLAMHGLAQQRSLEVLLAEEYSAHPGHVHATQPGTATNGAPRVAVGAGVSATAATPTSAVAVGAATEAGTAGDPEPPEQPKLGGRMAVRERPPGFGDPESKKSKGDKAKRVGRRYGHRVTGAGRRWFRENFRL